MLEIIKPYAPLISAASALISAVAVFASTGLVIWTTCFRKTRREKIDELKVEMLVLFSEGWDTTRVKTNKALEKFFQNLNPKFQKPKYKVLHQCAFDELGYEGKNEIFNLLKYIQQRYESGRTVTREGGFVEM